MFIFSLIQMSFAKTCRDCCCQWQICYRRIVFLNDNFQPLLLYLDLYTWSRFIVIHVNGLQNALLLKLFHVFTHSKWKSHIYPRVCVVIFSGHQGSWIVLMLTFDYRVRLMRQGPQWCGIFNYYWWTATIKPRLLFSHAGHASWRLFLFAVEIKLFKL